jgi:hypothetical protein
VPSLHPPRPSGRSVSRIGQNEDVTAWEYLVIALPAFVAPTTHRGESAAVQVLDELGADSWEAVGMTQLADGSVTVLLKRPKTS